MKNLVITFIIALWGTNAFSQSNKITICADREYITIGKDSIKRNEQNVYEYLSNRKSITIDSIAREPIADTPNSRDTLKVMCGEISNKVYEGRIKNDASLQNVSLSFESQLVIKWGSEEFVIKMIDSTDVSSMELVILDDAHIKLFDDTLVYDAKKKVYKCDKLKKPNINTIAIKQRFDRPCPLSFLVEDKDSIITCVNTDAQRYKTNQELNNKDGLFAIYPGQQVTIQWGGKVWRIQVGEFYPDNGKMPIEAQIAIVFLIAFLVLVLFVWYKNRKKLLGKDKELCDQGKLLHDKDEELHNLNGKLAAANDKLTLASEELQKNEDFLGYVLDMFKIRERTYDAVEECVSKHVKRSQANELLHNRLGYICAKLGIPYNNNIELKEEDIDKGIGAYKDNIENNIASQFRPLEAILLSPNANEKAVVENFRRHCEDNWIRLLNGSLPEERQIAMTDTPQQIIDKLTTEIMVPQKATQEEIEACAVQLLRTATGSKHTKIDIIIKEVAAKAIGEYGIEGKTYADIKTEVTNDTKLALLRDILALLGSEFDDCTDVAAIVARLKQQRADLTEELQAANTAKAEALDAQSKAEASRDEMNLQKQKAENSKKEAEKKVKDANEDLKKERKEKADLEKDLEAKTQECNEAKKNLEEQKKEWDDKRKAAETTFNEILKTLKAESDKKLKAQKVNHQKEVDSLNKKYDAGMAILGAARKHLTDSARDMLSAINEIVLALSDSCQRHNAKSVTTSLMAMILDSLTDTISDFTQRSNAWEEENADTLTQIPQLSALLCDNGLCQRGWINLLALLAAYSHIPAVADKMHRQGVDTIKLGKANEIMLQLLGMAEISLNVPNMLSEEFSNEHFDSVNSATRIDRITDDEILSQNYDGKIFDVIMIGYTVNGQTAKPQVKY